MSYLAICPKCSERRTITCRNCGSESIEKYTYGVFDTVDRFRCSQCHEGIYSVECLNCGIEINKDFWTGGFGGSRILEIIIMVIFLYYFIPYVFK